MDPDQLDEAIRYLTDISAALDAAVHALPEVGQPRSRPNDFAALARTIAFQQISTKAGLAIWTRFAEGFAPVNAPTIARATVEDILRCGFSRAKATYIKNIAAACGAGALDFARLARSTDEAARAELIAIKGIGPWTADIYLMFSLGRADIFPVGDAALAESYRRLAALEHRPDPSDMEHIVRDWSPWRSVAAHLLWSAYRVEPAKRVAW